MNAYGDAFMSQRYSRLRQESGPLAAYRDRERPGPRPAAVPGAASALDAECARACLELVTGRARP